MKSIVVITNQDDPMHHPSARVHMYEHKKVVEGLIKRIGNSIRVAAHLYGCAKRRHEACGYQLLPKAA